MKLISKNSNDVTLNVRTTGKETLDITVSKRNVHYWYPFNINFSYRYTESKRFLYLIKEKGYTGKNHYGVDILKRTRALGDRDGVMFHPEVYKRNTYIMEKAKALGIKTVEDQYEMRDVEQGYKIVNAAFKAIKNLIEDRYVSQHEDEELHSQLFPTEEWDEAVYSCMTEEESEAMQEIGEVYTMLSLMRKIV